MAPKTKKTKPKVKKEYIYQWPFTSRQEVAGLTAQYSVHLASDGSLSCNCPGWIFYRDKTKPRTCRHVSHDEVVKVCDVYLSMHKKGIKLPTSGTSPECPTNVPFARAIILD